MGEDEDSSFWEGSKVEGERERERKGKGGGFSGEWWGRSRYTVSQHDFHYTVQKHVEVFCSFLSGCEIPFMDTPLSQ